MARTEIEKEAYVQELVRVVTQMPSVFIASVNSIKNSFNTLIAYRDDPDTPPGYLAEIEQKINAGKTLVQNMLDNIT